MEVSIDSPLPTPTKEQSHPLLSPPPTDFPYPEEKRKRDSKRQAEPACQRPTPFFTQSQTGITDPQLKKDSVRTDGSGDNIYERANGDRDGRPADNDLGRLEKVAIMPARPTVSARCVTDAPRSAAYRPVMATTRHSTTARQTEIVKPADSNSSDEWSSDEETGGLVKTRSEPEHNPLSASRLNQVRRHPRKQSKHGYDGAFSIGNDMFNSRGKVAKDGRLNISVNETANSGYLAKALGGTLRRHLHPQPEQEEEVEDQQSDPYCKIKQQIPKLNIVIMVIGSRGDIQPFLKIGKILKDKHGHRVRIATHPTFKNFVEEDIGLEFFSVGGDPSELMAFMVKNPGLIPSMQTVREGEIGRRRDSMYEMFQGFWRACINATDDEKDFSNVKMMDRQSPFVADAIIANPPSFAHIHCAEKLGIPLHLVFTFPYTPTGDFPHPLANIKASNVDREHTNYMSYPLVDLMTWQGLGDLVNRFRVTTLGLEPVSTLWAPGQLSRLQVPTTYLWSPGLVPKPIDWGPEIYIAGYVFLDLASSFEPPDDLRKFLDAKTDKYTIYIGFGSISGIDDPAAFTKMIFKAVEKTGVRAVVSKGWGLRDDVADIPESICMMDNVPHDWLFPKMDAVVHHGGAGTTAIGLKCGKPTMIVPFFGDQPFWSAMIVRAGAGAKESLPLKKLTVDKFAEGIEQCLSPEAKSKAQDLAKDIEAEGDGAENAVKSFHRSLPLHGKRAMRCSVFPEYLAVWHLKHTEIQLSALAADLLIEQNQLKWSDLHLARHLEWQDFHGPGEPITGAGGALVASFQEVLHGLTQISENTRTDLKKRDKKLRRKSRHTVAAAVPLGARKVAGVRGKNDNLEKARVQQEEVAHEVNLHGNAEPPKGILDGDDTRRQQSPNAPTMSRASSALSSTEPESRPTVVSRDVARGIGHSTKAILTMPLEVWVALTLGFRNAPRLYGDSTVRPAPDNITGFRSGVKAAGDEFVLGFYDGFAGLIRIPVLDVKEGGWVALPKGLSKSLGGLVLKPISGLLGLGSYTGKGIQAGIRKRVRDTNKINRWLRRARMLQGAKEVKELTETPAHPALLQHGIRRYNPLDKARSEALTRWGSHERDLVEEARAMEKKSNMMVPMTTRSRKLTVTDRPPTIAA